MIAAIAALALTRSSNPVLLADAEMAQNERLPILPNPKNLGLSKKDRLEISGKVAYPVGQFMHADEFLETLRRRFDLSSAPGPTIQFDGGISDIKMPKQAFWIEVDQKGVHVFGQDEIGLQLGLRRLATLAFSENGHLYLPYGQLIDWPTAEWRGVSFTEGRTPGERLLQQELARRVLLPIGINEAIIHCENTEWDVTPKARGAGFVPKKDLASGFKWYRDNGIEPIPLVESFGQMDWFFQGGGSSDLAVDPQSPSVIDPRKPATAPLLDQLWTEVLDTTRATSVHFGCDQVAANGMPNDSDLLTKLWKIQIPSLAAIAKKNSVKMIVAGDQMLGPGEGIDNCNAPSVDVAKARRAVLPEGTTVVDLHLRDTFDFARFFPSLDLWQQASMKTIAASGTQPANVRSSAIVGVQRKAGVLASTLESNPALAFNQFASFVLSAEYAWSGRQDDINDLGYDYRDVFWRLMFEAPIRVTPGAGFALGAKQGTAPQVVGRYRYIPFAPATDFNVPATLKARKLVAFVTGDGVDKVGTPVANLKVTFSDGDSLTVPLVYGLRIRGKTDVEKVKDRDFCPMAEFSDGVFAIRLSLAKVPVDLKVEPIAGAFTKVSLVGADALL